MADVNCYLIVIIMLVTEAHIWQNSTVVHSTGQRRPWLLCNHCNARYRILISFSRQDLRELNEHAYAVCLSLSSKGSVLGAWDKKRSEAKEPEPNGEPESISTLRADVKNLQMQLDSLETKRSELEWDLGLACRKADNLEEVLPLKASNQEQREILHLLRRLHDAEVDSE